MFSCDCGLIKMSFSPKAQAHAAGLLNSLQLLKFSYSVLVFFAVIASNCLILGSGYGSASGEIRASFDQRNRSTSKSVPSPVSSLTVETVDRSNRRNGREDPPVVLFPSSSYGPASAHNNFHHHHYRGQTLSRATTTEEPIPFIEPASLNTSVYLGQTASLPCVVKHLGDKTVSWIRGKDLHILASGVHVYTNDRRVVLQHHDGKLRHLWTLNIQDIQLDDDGVYECQLNTEPKLTSMHYLHVLIEPLNDDADAQSRSSPLASLDSRSHLKRQDNAARLLGPSLVRHREGETVHFTCLVPNTRATTNVTWFLNDIPIERSSATRGGFRIETEVYAYSVMSKLIMFHVFKRDAGKYSCGGLSVYPASITLIVQNDSTGLSEGDGDGGRFSSSTSSSSAAAGPLSSINLIGTLSGSSWIMITNIIPYLIASTFMR